MTGEKKVKLGSDCVLRLSPTLLPKAIAGHLERERERERERSFQNTVIFYPCGYKSYVHLKCKAVRYHTHLAQNIPPHVQNV